MSNPRGQQRDKPFRDALRMEIAAVGEDHKALRAIARNLINLAQEPTRDAIGAIKEIADRLDGKVPQGITGDDEGDPIRIVTDTERAKALAAFIAKMKLKGG